MYLLLFKSIFGSNAYRKIHHNIIRNTHFDFKNIVIYKTGQGVQGFNDIEILGSGFPVKRL